MNTIEKMMRENKDLFMDQEPKVGHFERFEQKLQKANRKTKVISLTRQVSRIAAIGLLVIMSSLWAYNEFLTEPEMRLGEVSTEYKKVEFFYTSQINSFEEDLNNVPFIQGTEYEESMNEELQKMDSVYAQLKKELGANPNDERIIQAMIAHYQTKLQVMKGILEKLENYQNLNNNNSQNQNQYESVTL